MFEGVAPGLQLGSALAQVDRSTLSGPSLIDLLSARSRQIAHDQAQLLADMVAVAAKTPVEEFAPMEIASALGWTRQAAGAQLALAQDLVVRLPSVHAALAAGHLDLPKARVIADSVADLELSTAREVAQQILPLASSATTGQLRARLSKMVIEVDPEAALKRHRRRVKGRRVVLQPDPDGCASLLGFDLPAAAALTASNRLTEIARSAQRVGDLRSVDQLRADAFLDLLLGNDSHAASHPAKGGVEIIASLEMLTRLSNEPGHLAGYGAVIADIARQVASQQRKSPWTFSVHDPLTGRVYNGLTRRRPSAAMSRSVSARDRVCRAPGCRVPASRADLDHTVAWEAGGLTYPGNLGVLCRHHHRAKHVGGWRLTQPRAGQFTWRSPLGKIYEIWPEPP